MRNERDVETCCGSGGAAGALSSVLPGMAENNNVLEEDTAHSLTKLRLLCTKMVQDAREAGITTEEIKAAYLVMKYNELDDSVSRDESKCVGSARVMSAKRWHQWGGVGAVVALVVAVILCCYGDFIKSHLVTSKCLVRNNYIIMEATRPLTKCERVCSGVGGALELSANISREEFERWAYLSRPLVVRGGAAHWPALDKFSVGFLRSLYDSIEGSYEAVTEDCQFLPFRSEFLDLRTALAMHPARASARSGTKHWYFGWSNCSPGVSTVLRQLAPRPAFLPALSESSALDWIFMGCPGPGAAWHLDYVQRPSWQAQIRGIKTWYLRPVPECQSVCHPFNVTVYRGDIIFVDTNQWYHTTHIHEGGLSITLGSEYD